jgi:hypothetical protein
MAPNEGALSAFAFGYSLHATRTIAVDDTDDLEQLCRYGARAPISNDRLSVDQRGQVHVRLSKRYYDGRTELVMPPVALLRKLAALVPPPRKHLTRYHGIFAPAHRFRNRVPFAIADDLVSLPGYQEEEDAAPSPLGDRPRNNRLAWAELLMRVFAVDVLVCDACGAPMRILAFITNLEVADKILDHLGLELPRATGPPRTAAPLAEISV